MRTSGSASSPRIEAVSSCPSTNSSAITSGSKVAAKATAGARSAAVRTFVMPERGALVRRLHEERQAQAVQRRAAQSVSALGDGEARRRDAGGEPHELGAPLVHRERGGHDAAAGVGDAQHLERALHRAVLAEAAVQRDEGAREALALQVEELALLRVEGVRVHALLAQRRRARALPEMSEISRSAEGPPIRTATLPRARGSAMVASRVGRRCAPRARARRRCVACTVACTCSITRLDVGRRRAAEVHDEVGVLRARPARRPRVKPLSPHDSMSRAAWSPGGLRKTLPALGWLERLGGHALHEQRLHARHRRRLVARRRRRRSRRDEPLLAAARAGARAGSRSRSRRAVRVRSDAARGRSCAPTPRGSRSRRRSSRRSSRAPRRPFPGTPAIHSAPAPPWRATKRARCGAGTPAPATKPSFGPSGAGGPDAGERVVREDHGAVEAAVAHEQVAAQARRRAPARPPAARRGTPAGPRGPRAGRRRAPGRPRASSRASPSARRGGARRAGPAARRVGVAHVHALTPSPPAPAPARARAPARAPPPSPRPW